jgi:hypothetical protein
LACSLLKGTPVCFLVSATLSTDKLYILSAVK